MEVFPIKRSRNKWRLVWLALALGACGEVASVQEQAQLPFGAIQSISLAQTPLLPVTVDVPYKEKIPAHGGQPPLAFKLLGGTLPPGLSLQRDSGIVEGTVTREQAQKAFNFTVEVSDALGTVAQQSYALDVNAYSFQLAPTELPSILPGVPFSMSFAAVGASPPVQFSTSGTLPPGLALNEAGKLYTDETGIAKSQENTTWKFEVIATDALGVSARHAYELELGEFLGKAPLTIETVQLAKPTAGADYSAGIVVTGGTAPYKFALTTDSDPLPDGLTLSEGNGLVAGQVARAEAKKTFELIVEVTDAEDSKAVQRFTVTVGEYQFAVAPIELPTIVPGIPFSLPFSAVGATPPVKYSSSGTLPPGLALDAAGVLSTGPGGIAKAHEESTWSFEVIATDSLGVIARQSYELALGKYLGKAPLAIQTVALPTPAAGNEYSAGIAASGGAPPYTFAVESGTLPSALALAPTTGILSGTVAYAQAGQPYNVTIKVTDSEGQTATKSYTGVVGSGSATLTIHTSSLVAPVAGNDYSAVIAVTGGATPYAFAVDSGSLPSGLTLNASTGMLSGTVNFAASGQNYVVVVRVTDAVGQTTTKTYSGTVGSGIATLAFATTTIPVPVAGSPYSAIFQATGGKPPYTYVIESGGLVPAGLTLDSSTGVLSGTLPHSETSKPYVFTVRITDSITQSQTRTFNGTVSPYAINLVPASLATGDPGRGYSATLTGVGGQAAYTFSLVSGTMPSTLTLNASTGVISGTLSEAEAGLSKSFRVAVTDANGISTFRDYTFNTAGFDVAVTTSSLADANEGETYSATLAASGGTAPYTYEYTGTLPTGVGITSAGAFFGAPAASTGSLAGTPYTVTVRARDATGRVSMGRSLTLTVNVTSPSLANATPATAVLGSAYSMTLSASGGRGPYTYSLAVGSLPSGLSLSAAGVISGTPVATAACPAAAFTARVTDALAQQATRTFCVPAVTGMVVTNTSFPTVVRGQIYTATINVSGGTSPYSFSGSSLPPGLSLDSATGVISGSTVAAVGSVTSYVSITDANGLSMSRAVILTVADALALGAVTFAKGGTGRAYGPVTVTATGGVPPYTFSLGSGSLPTGLTLTSGGVISGTISASAVKDNPFTFQIAIEDSSGLEHLSTPRTIQVSVSPRIVDASLPVANVNVPYAAQVQVQGGVPPFTFSATGLPAGLSIGASSGFVSGTPTGVHAAPIDVTVTDANGISGTRSVGLSVLSAGKSLNFHAAKVSEPCPLAAAANCDPRGYKVGKLVTAQATTHYVAYGNYAGADPRVYVARLDAKGRIATPGTSALNKEIVAPGNVSAIDLADMDFDGHLDIVASDISNNRVVIFWNDGTVDANGMPNFSASNNFNLPASPQRPYELKVVSLRNGANAARKDVVVVDYNPAAAGNASRTVVFLGGCASSPCTRSSAIAATGTAVANTVSGQALIHATNIDAGYFYNTSCKDIVVTGRQGNNNNSWIVVHRQDISAGVCQGTFAAGNRVEYGSGLGSNYYPAGIAVADFNADGYDDLAIGYSNAAFVHVFVMGAGTGLAGSTSYLAPTSGAAGEVLAYCLDGTSSCTYPSVLAFGNRDRGHVQSINNWSGGTGFVSVIPNTSGVFENMTSALRIDYSLPAGLGAQPSVAPVLGTGRNDLVVMGSENNAFPFLVTLQSSGSASNPFRQYQMMTSLPDDFAAAAEVGTIALADVNDDGFPDLVSHLVNQQAVAVHLGPLGEAYAPAPLFVSAGVQHGYPYTPNHQQRSMIVSDFDLDGYPDIALTGSASRAIAVMQGFGGGTFGSPVLYNTGDGDTRPLGVASGDIDNDGITDLVVINMNAVTAAPSVTRFKGRGDGTFEPAVDIANGTTEVGCVNPRSLQIVDLDRDTKPEIIIVCYNSAQIVVFRRHTDGNWKKNNGTIAVGGNNGTSIAVGHLTPGDACYSFGADFVNRPCQDVVIGAFGLTDSIRVLSNLTLGTPAANGTFNVQFTANTAIPLGGWVHHVELADIDQDGYSDVLASMSTQNGTNTQAGQYLAVCKGNGAGNCAAVERFGMEGPYITGLAVGDVTNDGLLDVFAGYRTGQRIPFRMLSRFINSSN